MLSTKVAMVISIAGVLVAGSAAALVNTQVLNGASPPPSPAVVQTVPQVQQTTPTDTVAPFATAPVAAAAPVGAASTATQAVYQVGDSGTVTLDTAGDVLTIVAVTPASGWTVTESEAEGHDAEVKFRSATGEAEFHANMLFGVVTTEVESDGESAPGSDDYEGSDDAHEVREGSGDDD